MLKHSNTLERQKHAASEANRYWFLARYRILEGYFGAAKFYQWQSARWHQKSVELRAQYDREKLFNSIPDRDPTIEFAMLILSADEQQPEASFNNVTDMLDWLNDYHPARNYRLDHGCGSLPNPTPESLQNLA